ncbi:DMT family transporter [Brevibacillus humidisoli]|uniref:EamA family transporter n=1 Tax=Brevibacillus humidisoli TaxID=2895522 RepID=UPI001E3342AE|nr:DMT family transporter [Brevibacillus humidisoli]UFJ39823.1 DMT family transporter [Brevibacillus humidisoli]
MLYLVIFLVTLIWGVNGLIDRKALSTSHPIEVNFITTLTMVAVVFLSFTLARWSGVPFHFHKNTVLYAVLNGILIPASFIIYLYALSKDNFTTVITITATYPLITCILASILFKEPLTANKFIGLTMTVIGLYFVLRD